jgi:DNA-directed RNA polymerase specialized sigma24 family protein
MGVALLLGWFRTAGRVALKDPKDASPSELPATDFGTSDEEYRLLRRKLMRFFEWNRCESPEDLASETIYRAMRRVAEGQTNTARHPHGYFYGFARNLLREEWKRPVAEPMPEGYEGEEKRLADTGLHPIEQRILIREGLARLTPEESDLIVRYFTDGPEKLCARTGLSPNALRIRVHRIRKRLEEFCKSNVETR